MGLPSLLSNLFPCSSPPFVIPSKCRFVLMFEVKIAKAHVAPLFSFRGAGSERGVEGSQPSGGVYVPLFPSFFPNLLPFPSPPFVTPAKYNCSGCFE